MKKSMIVLVNLLPTIHYKTVCLGRSSLAVYRSKSLRLQKGQPRQEDTRTDPKLYSTRGVYVHVLY